MVSYKQKDVSYAWLVGIVVFVIAMMICFSDVYGLDQFNYQRIGNGHDMTDAKISGSYNENLHHITITLDEPLYEITGPVGASVPSIPEPATLTLLGVGLGALLIRGRKE